MIRAPALGIQGWLGITHGQPSLNVFLHEIINDNKKAGMT